VLAMSQLRSDILTKRKCKEIETAEQQYKLSNIAAPIQPYDNDDQESTEPLPFVSDNETNPSTPDNPSARPSEISVEDDEEEHWSHVIENWIDMLNVENCLDNVETIDNEIPEFEFDEHITHPADNQKAK
ncbi:7031_t:CDS:1, partial [Racocetra fulgida]